MTVNDYAAEAAKAAPPVTVAGSALLGIAIADWVAYATLFYLLLQVAVIAPKVWATIKDFINERSN